MQIFLSMKWIDSFVSLAFDWLNTYNIWYSQENNLQFDKDYSL